MSIKENIELVRANIAEAARAAGRDPAEITLVGASKMNDSAACREAVAAGIDALGENRVQEMLPKLEDGAYAGVPLHFIGHLQRNKVRQVVGKVALIQSVGSREVLLEIQRQAERMDVIQECLLEVNIGGEAAKSGFLPEDLLRAASEAQECPRICVRGLMTIPPIETEEGQNLRNFEKVYRLYVDINQNLYDNKLKILSMGMSGDYQTAISAGATMVRVGTAIFGNRAYPVK